MKSCRAIKVMLVLAIALAATVAQANLITNPGFETEETIHIWGHPGLPSVYGDWGGDVGTIVVAENGILPAGGERMLRFDATGNYADPVLSHCQIYQLIDISSYAAEIAAGDATATLSGLFNRVQVDAQTDTAFNLALYALSGPPSAFWPDTFLQRESAGVYSDSDPRTWESVTTSMLLPVNTDYLAVRLMAWEDVYNDGAYPEFDGHYADQISLTIGTPSVPCEPQTVLLLGLGMLSIIGARRRLNR